MRRIKIVFALCAISAGAMLLSHAAAVAQADTKEILVQDFKAFNERCPGPPSSYSQSCVSELAQLTRRQQALHLTDTDLEAAGARGGFQGGIQVISV